MARRLDPSEAEVNKASISAVLSVRAKVYFAEVPLPVFTQDKAEAM
jgi:hypothetical protein